MLDLTKSGQYYAFSPVLLEICEGNIAATLILGYLYAHETWRQKSGGTDYFSGHTSLAGRILKERLGLNSGVLSKAVKYLLDRDFITVVRIKDEFSKSYYKPGIFAKINFQALQPFVDYQIQKNKAAKVRVEKFTEDEIDLLEESLRNF